MKRLALSIIVLLSYVICEAQTFQIANYNRSSITILVLPNTGNYDNDLNAALSDCKSIELSDRYYINPVDDIVLNSKNDEFQIASDLKNGCFAAQSLMSWRDEKMLVSRACYNLTAQQRSQLASSFRGAESVKDERWFKHLLKSNYILVISIDKLEEMSNITSKKQLRNFGISFVTGSVFSTLKDTKCGYIGNVTAYLYHITMNDVDYVSFIRYWDNDAKQLSYQYEIELVAKKSIGIDGTCDKTDVRLNAQSEPSARTSNENNKKGSTSTNTSSGFSHDKYNDNNKMLFRIFASEAANQALFTLGESYMPITPKAMVESSHPVKAELGKKEGLRPDDLIFAYELKEHKDGSLGYHKTGTYRVKSVGDNRTDVTKTSEFYNVNWGKAKEGMILIPREEKGLSISPGLYFYPQTVFRLDLGFSLARLRSQQRSARTKLLVDFGYSGSFIDENGFFDYYATTNFADYFRDANGLYTIMYGVGIQKDFYILPSVQLSPYALIEIEHSWYKDKQIVDGEMGYYQLPYNYGRILYPQFGLKIPINITYFLKVVPEVSCAFKINSMSLGAGSSSFNDGEYSRYIEKKDRIFGGLSIQLDL